MTWYSREDARFDAWVTGNWGEDSVSDEDDEEDSDLCPDCHHEPRGGDLRPDAAKDCACWCH